MKRILITGASGFIGSRLAGTAREDGLEVVGLTRNAELAAARDALRQCDLTREGEFSAIIREVRPDIIFHLAGLPGSAPAMEIYRANVLGTAAIIECLRESMREGEAVPDLVLLSSSAVYGNPEGEGAVFEEAPLKPVTPYGVSKVAADLMGLQFHAETGHRVVIARPFNVIGPGQSEKFFVPRTAGQVAAIEAGQSEPVLKLGDLSSFRDFTDVRDIARGILEIGRRGKAGRVYNLCSGRGTAIRDVVTRFTEMAKVQVEIETKHHAGAGLNVAFQAGSTRRAEDEISWRANIPLEKSLQDILDYHRREVHA